ncbi:pyridoxamine 5'-phosphate oxidase family protein [Dyadobacter sp. CY261]|uniref:packaged DNA stabilization protein n=1 Tax=Dyadobacter sp. CY261 TaxID=2907203 RepID=UPI001F3A1845|nr:packaged DNA stabilization protein [Dyadobacter sp. CY261]MCF0075442.1 pyridoxamine 5'-phosphate oxidase family protein [Dyadobacter sp. CY261]
MKIQLAGPSYQQRSLPFDAQRSVNLFPVPDEYTSEKVSLYSTPGLKLFGNVGSGPIRGEFAAANGRAFFVSGAKLYELNGDGTGTDRGTLDFNAGIVSIEENGFQLAICDGRSIYILTYATNAFAKVTDPDLPKIATITFLDGYFIGNKNNSGQFYISALYDGLNWGALDFATAESSPDDLLRVQTALGQLWLLGARTSEVYTNTGASAFPFERISGAKMEVGIMSPHTAVAIDNSIVWVGQDKNGVGIVYRANGFTPKRISTTPIEIKLQSVTDYTQLRAYTYQEDGHFFYVITGGSLETSLVYDLTTQLWHERAYLNEQGLFEQHLGCCYMFAFNKHLVGSRVDGKIYEQSLDYYSDDGEPLCRERTYTHLLDELKRIRYNTLVIGCETGVGLQSGQGVDPVIMLQLSRDSARTWSNWFTTSLGKVGQYLTKVSFRRLGIAQQMTFKIRITDPVKVTITGSWLE